MAAEIEPSPLEGADRADQAGSAPAEVAFLVSGGMETQDVASPSLQKSIQAEGTSEQILAVENQILRTIRIIYNAVISLNLREN